MRERGESVQAKRSRIRAPRVHITYDCETAGAVLQRELPFVVGVLANLSGDRAERAARSDARFVQVDLDNFQSLLRAIGPRLTLDRSGEPVELEFTSLSDFEPASLVERVPFLAEASDDELAPRLRSVMRDPGFRSLEAAWRGLWFLVTRTETGERIKIQALDVSKRALLRDLDLAPEVDQSRLFKRVYEDSYGTTGGEPFAALIGDFRFSHHPEDVRLLQGLSALAAAAHAPFIAGASPALFGLESFAELGRPRDLARIFDSVEYTAWNAFRDSEDSRWIALTAPRFLLRRAHHWRREEPRPFVFHEAEGNGAEELPWGNAAFALAACMTASFAQQSWCSSIQGLEGGGLLEDLPTWDASGGDGPPSRICTEALIGDRRELEVSDSGIVPLLSVANYERGLFFSAPSCQRPRQYDDESATGNARIMARLPTLLACARFAHYLKVICRDRIGSSFERASYERLLNDWIVQYVRPPEEVSSPETLARHPLNEARIEVSEVSGAPGRYQAMVYLRPRLGVAEMQTSVRMVVALRTI